MSAVAAAKPQGDVTSPETYAARLYERHNRAIFGLCLKELRSREDADDALQTTFIYALLSLRRGVVPQMELPWLFTIARNACSTRRRSGSRRGAHESPHDLDSLQDRLASPDRSDVATSEDFLCALRAIPESQRKALLLREWRGLSYEEIGSELGLSQAATEALLFRARHNVTRQLGGKAGLKTLNGASLLSFLRNLFQTAAAKTLAVGAGAALTLAAVPAAEPHPRDISAPQPAPVRVHAGGASATQAPVAPPRLHAPARRREVARRLDPVRLNTTDVKPARRDAAPLPTTARTPAEPAPASPPSPPSNDAATPATLVDNVVETASDLGDAVNLPGPSLPPVAAPTVELPPLELPSTTLPALTP